MIVIKYTSLLDAWARFMVYGSHLAIIIGLLLRRKIYILSRILSVYVLWAITCSSILSIDDCGFRNNKRYSMIVCSTAQYYPYFDYTDIFSTHFPSASSAFSFFLPSSLFFSLSLLLSSIRVCLYCPSYITPSLSAAPL